ncbi:MAG TPA: GNAT family N-acetyltransferase [Actinomycetota bacterium]|nr:GNAT family N-acetyltransferase [Actinomycetota bacterium]
MRRQLADGYELDDDPERVDPGAVWAFLSTEAYWGRERTRADLDRQLQAASRLVGLYRGREQVGFARIVTDGRVAYLADVYVLDGHRGRGFGAELVRFAVDEGPHAGLRWMLHTRDAHDLYARFGFGPPDERYLERPPAVERD